MTEIQFAEKVTSALSRAEAVLVLAPKALLDKGWHRTALAADWAAALDPVVEDLKPGLLGAVGGTYGTGGAPRRFMAGALPDEIGRHNSPTRAESVRHCVSQANSGDAKKVAIVACLADPDHYVATAVAVARCYPFYDATTDKKDGGQTTVSLVSVLEDGTPVRAPADVRPTVESLRLAARLVDTPAQEMRTSDMEAEARAAVKDIPGVKVTSIVGDRLLAVGLGGIHGVGRAATVAPRLVVLEYKPPKRARRTVALVGKGVIYDTGGLSIKVGGIMCTMKGDMGGAAAVLGAFLTLARMKSRDRLFCVLTLAENAVGPDSYRPDDILRMHSGKTVEINNTDAEGRLLLADGVSWAARKLKADFIIDAATLTGAALVTSGKIVSSVATNRDGLEARVVASGRRTGDVTHPLLFIPEFLKQEFKSKVADMRNSVADRMNAQSSCAAQFVYNHIEDLNPAWVHLDIAGPAFRDGRATGYGVALIIDLVNTVTDADLK